MEERKYTYSDIEILYNIYGKFIYMIGRENLIDGNVLFYELDNGEKLDLESYALHGYLMVRDKSPFLKQFEEYSLGELRSIEEKYEQSNKKEIPREFLIDLNWLMDSIEQSKYNYDQPYPVEQIEVRYSELLKDFIFLYVLFDYTKKRLSYMDMSTGLQLDEQILSFYTYYPRDEILKKETYTPRETVDLRVQLNKDNRALGKKL